ncbi:MAG TPA: hypothetical protein VFY49_20765, partial [Myxococcota bacterium]|nr:hypothetical protein [Myxococcota bacterium]
RLPCRAMEIAKTKQIQGRRLRLGRALDARIVFLHVTKCGGNSLRLALRDVYRSPFSGGGRRRLHVSPGTSRRAAESLGIPTEAFRDALLRYHLRDDAKCRLFTGHFFWPEKLLDEFPDVSFVTLLRDPVAHFLSNYYEAREDGRSGESLEAFLDSEAAERIGTRFARNFAGSVFEPDKFEPAQIELAQSRLAQVAVLGVLEDLPGFIDDFERRFGARLRLPHANAGALRQRAAREELSDALRARIAERVAANQALYDFARSEIARRRAAR